jgi:phosphoribosyl 1,2-cyclic phosphate phosphodiesterase
MTLTLLGTGANECIPAFRCSCPNCTNARQMGGRHIRQNSCALLSNGKEQFLIDMPPQIIPLLRSRNITETQLKGIFFTHRHEDHILGARYLFNSKGISEDDTGESLNVFMPASAYHAMSGKFLYGKKETRIPQKTKGYTIRIPRPYRSLRAGSIRVTPLETNHLKKKGSVDDSFGYLIENEEGRRIAYLIDASRDLPMKTLDILGHCRPDLLITDCTYSKTDPSGCHSDIRGAEILFKAVRPGRMIVSHIGHQNFNHDVLVEKLSAAGIETGYDGMKIVV